MIAEYPDPDSTTIRMQQFCTHQNVWECRKMLVASTHSHWSYLFSASCSRKSAILTRSVEIPDNSSGTDINLLKSISGLAKCIIYRTSLYKEGPGWAGRGDVNSVPLLLICSISLLTIRRGFSGFSTIWHYIQLENTLRVLWNSNGPKAWLNIKDIT